MDNTIRLHILKYNLDWSGNCPPSAVPSSGKP